MWHAIIAMVLVANNGTAHPTMTQIIEFKSQQTCAAFISHFEQQIKAANPRDIVVAKCEKIAPRANA
jgi:hypothetical protein